MIIPKRNKKRKYTRRDKAPASPPADKMVRNTRVGRQCDYCLRITSDVYCPNCGRVTVITK